MIPELGHFALAMACAIALAQTVVPIWGAHRHDRRLMAMAPALALAQLLALVTAAGALVASSVGDDFTVLNVAENSHTLKPLLYKITGTWGNHEGSILLWGLILGLCGGAVATFGRGLPSALRARVIGVLGGTSAGFLLFCLLASDPFARLWPAPIDGRDMNPLLQDPGLAVPTPRSSTRAMSASLSRSPSPSPPCSRAASTPRGAAGFAVDARLVVSAHLRHRARLLVGLLRTRLGWFLVLGPGRECQPAAVADRHRPAALGHRRREARGAEIWTVLLAIATFSLSLSGTFLVRSGILNSVHAFANDPTRGVFILGLLALVIGGSLLLFAFRAPALSPGGLFAPISREGALVFNNIMLCSIAAVVITGTLYPLIADFIFGHKISVGAPFFNATVLPLAIPIFAVMTIAPAMAWKRSQLWPAIRRLWWAGLIAAVVGAIALYGAAKVLPALAFAGATWMVLGAAAEIIERIRLFRIPVRDSFSRLIGLRLSLWGTALGHAGMGITVAGIAGMSLATESIVALRPGQSADSGGYHWTLVDLHNERGPNYVSRIATIDVTKDGKPFLTLHPSRRTFPVQQMTTTEAAIYTNGMRDLYTVLGEERDGVAVLRLHDNFLAPWIWFGALIMASGGGMSLLDRRARVGAPRRAATRPGSAIA